MTDGEFYETMDYDKSSLPADLLASLKKPRLQDGGSGKPPVLPPGKPRYTKEPVKNIPPPLSVGKKPVMPSITPKLSGSLPASAPPTGKKPPKKKSDTLPSAKLRSASQDSAINPNQWKIPSPPPILSPPIPRREGREDQTLLLSDLVRKHSKELPLRVRVEEGYCGSEERYVISAGDIYNFHFVKNEKVVSVSDCGSNHFSIPFNSEIKFGLLYNPNNNFKEAIKGYTFNSVSDLVSSASTPRLVRVLTSSPKCPVKSLLSCSELLVIRKASKTVLRKSFIKAFSFNTKEEKTLYDDSGISFTTEPSSLQLYVPEIMEHFPDSFPLEAMMYPGEDAEDLPPHLISDIVTLTHTSIESAIIATTYWGEDDAGLDDDDQVPISIPIEMDIEVAILNDTDEDELYLDTKVLLQSLDLSKVKDMKKDNGAGNENEGGVAKRKLNHKVRKGYELRGVNITLSQKVSDDPGLKSSFFSSILNQPLPAPPLGLPSSSPVPPPNLSTPQHLGTIKPMPSVPSQLLPNIIQPLPPSRSPTLSSKPSLPLPPTRGSSLDDSSTSHDYSTSPRRLRAKPRSKTIGIEDDDYVNDDPYMNIPAPPAPSPRNSLSSKTVLTRPRSPRNSVPAGPTHKVGENSQSNGVCENSEPADVAKMTADVEFLRRLVTVMQDNSLKDMTFLREEVRGLTVTMETLSANCKELQSQVEELNRNKHEHSAESATYGIMTLTKTVDPEKQRENMANLRAMGTIEMLHLLDVMKLPQYKELFEGESIDGEILAECDEALLEEELHIKNKLHRSRLMKVITGRHSVRNIEHGLDPYDGTVTY